MDNILLLLLAALYACVGVWVEDRWYRVPVGLKAWIMLMWPLAMIAAVLPDN
jgi:hypothetical protein